jgi:predicted short-subunit dehydrogenase-like oxidoreductase (DUF2520 family)
MIPGCRVAPPQAADLVLLTIPDGAIVEVAQALPWRSGQSVVHCAGSLGREALEAAAHAGALTGTWHPLQSLAAAPADLQGVRFAIDAPPPLAEDLARLSRAVGGVPLSVPPEGRAVYHLGATLVSNYAVALVALAAQLWEMLGFDRASAVGALAPLLRGTAKNLVEVGLPDALTGPVVRGDAATLDRHLAELERLRPDLVPVYRALGRAALELAKERGLPDDRVQSLQQRLVDPAQATTAVAGGS